MKGLQVRKSAIGILVLVVLTLCGRSMAQDFSATLKSADDAFAERDYSTARSLYERAIREGAQLNSDLPRARNLASAYLNATPSETAKAIQWLQTAVRLDPQADGMRLQLCRLMLNTGDTSGAVENYRALVERHPQSSDYVLGMASALRQDGKSDAALRLLKDTVDKFPNLNVVRVEYARGLNFVREFSEARRQFQKVLDHDPNDLIAQVGMAKSMSYDGDQEGALVEYDRILRAHPGLYDAMIGKAFALLWSGHMEEARDLLQKGLARHPDDREVRDALNSLPKGSGKTASVPAEPPYVPPAPSPEPATVAATPVEMHQAVFGNSAMEPRTITPPKSAKSHGKNVKSAGAPETVAMAPLSEAKAEANLPVASDGYLGTLYAAIAVMVVLLALAAVTLWNLQKARKAEHAAAEQARREDFVAGAVHMNAAAMIVAAKSRRLNDVFTAKVEREPVVIDYAPEQAEAALQEEPLMSAEMSSVMDSPRVAAESRVEERPLVPEVAGISRTEAPKIITNAPQVSMAPEIVFEKKAPVVASVTPIATSMKPDVIAQEVMIVGGLPSVVQLQCRWLSSLTHKCTPLLVRDWTTAADRIAAAPPSVIVLNSGSDDRWTSLRMLAWIVEHHPELRHRVIAVTTADHYPTNCEDLVICEPIDAREWQQKLAVALSASQSELRVAIGEGMRMHPTGYSARQ